MSQSGKLPERLIAAFPGKVTKLELNPEQDAVLVEPVIVHDFFKYLKDNDTMKFDYLSSLSGVDAVEHLEVVYHISSTVNKQKLTVKVKLPTQDPEIVTICDLYRAADWFEREICELYGINIKNHPDLRPLLLPEGWDEGPPMRKGWTGKDFIVKPE
jgi:NADH:ubiquinone oxidoreductase subunit C